MQGWFEFTVNGETRRVEGEGCFSTLLDYLDANGFESVLLPRGAENPGSDAVLMLDVNGAGRPAYRLICSSLLPLPQAAGRRFITLEGLTNADPPHPVAELVRKHAPRLPHEAKAAIHLALLEAWYRYDLLEPHQVAEGYAGFCFRSGGFRRLGAAAEELVERVIAIRSEADPNFAGGTPEALAELRRRGAQAGVDPFQDAFSAPLAEEAEVSEPLSYVDSSSCRFYRPETIAEVQKLRIEYPEATISHSGLVLARNGADPAATISTAGIAEMRVILEHDDHFEIGAEVSLTLLAESLPESFESLRDTIESIECRAVRNQLTLAEHLLDSKRPPVLALPLYLAKAEFRTLSSDGEHHVSVPGYFKTRATRDEQSQQLLRSVILPKEAAPEQARRTYVFGTGAANPNLIGAAGLSVELNDEGVVNSLRVAFAGFDSKLPVLRVNQLEEALAGKAWGEGAMELGAKTLAEVEIQTFTDSTASAETRQQLMNSALRRFHRDCRLDKEAPEPTAKE
ncbi:MAG: FAD binding domain-containing protein, partial [Verrucomicrobiota bacterium]